MTIAPGNEILNVPSGFRAVDLTREPVELCKVLKFEGLVSSGGHARAAVAAGQVRVNGLIETRKRKQIVSGDTIQFEGHKIFVQRCESTVVDDKRKTAPKALDIEQSAAEARSDQLLVRPKKT